MKEDNSTFNIQHSQPLDIPCVILSGGKSSRMGEDKSLLPFRKFDTMIEYQHNKLSKIFKNVYISSKTDKFQFDCKVIQDINQNISSPMIALESIFNTLDAKNIFIITVDVPLIKTSTIYSLIKNATNYNITIPFDGEKYHYLCGVFNISIKKTIDTLLQKDIHQIKTLIENTLRYQSIKIYPKEQFLNINTPLEYKKLEDLGNFCKL